MAEFMLKCAVGLRLANWNASLNEPANVEDLDHEDYLGPIYDADATNYAGLGILKISLPTDVSVSDLGPMVENFTTVDTVHDYEIEIRQTGGFSFEIYEDLDTTNGTASMGLLYGSLFLRNGCNNTSAGAKYRPQNDTTPGVAATDLRGYTGMLEWTDEAGKFRWIKFANCRLKATPSPASQRGSKLRVELSDARIITIGNSDTTSLVTS